MIGSCYLERGQPVTVLTRWGPGNRSDPRIVAWLRDRPRSAPRNVAIRRDDGSVVVRPFRGLRRPKENGHG